MTSIKSKSIFTSVSRDKSLNNLSVTKRDRIPVVTSLPPVEADGHIIYNRSNSTYYGSDGVDWIPLGGTAETGTGKLTNNQIILNPTLVAGAAATQIDIQQVTQTFGAAVPIPEGIPSPSAGGVYLSPGVWSVRALARVQSQNTGAGPGAATISLLLDGSPVVSDGLTSISRNEPVPMILDGFIQVLPSDTGLLTLQGINSAAGQDNVTVYFGWYVTVQRILTF